MNTQPTETQYRTELWKEHSTFELKKDYRENKSLNLTLHFQGVLKNFQLSLEAFKDFEKYVKRLIKLELKPYHEVMNKEQKTSKWIKIKYWNHQKGCLQWSFSVFLTI